jgi:O-antigen/teichoic acid export membrane protein
VGVIKRQGIKNTIITYIGILIGAINIVFVQPKLLTEEELGLTRLLQDVSYLLALAIPIGLPSIILKYFPHFRDREKKHQGFAGFILLVFLVGFVISTIVIFAFKSRITGFYQKHSALFVDYFLFIIPFAFIVSAITVTTAYCQALFKSTIPSFLSDIFVRLGIIFVTVFYCNRWISFDTYIYMFIGIYAVQVVLLICYILMIDKVSLIPDRQLLRALKIKKILGFGLLLCLASFASIAVRKVDVIFLGTSSLGLVAVYTTAVFIASFIEAPLGAMERISHTKIADNFAKNNLTEIEKIYKESVKYLLLLGGFLFVGIITTTKHIYEIGGLPASYLQCIGVVYIVSFGALVNISTGFNSALMFYSSHYVFGTFLLVGTLILTIILNLILIPMYGVYGAAFASAGGAIIYNFAKFVFIYLKFRFQPYTMDSLKIVLIIMACSFISWLLPGLSAGALLNFFIKGSIVAIFYISAIYWLKLAPELFDMIGSRLKRKNA